MSSSVFGVRSGDIQRGATLRQTLREVGVSAYDGLHHQVDRTSKEFFQVFFQTEITVEQPGGTRRSKDTTKSRSLPSGSKSFPTAEPNTSSRSTPTNPAHFLDLILDKGNHGFTLTQYAQKGPEHLSAPRSECN